MTARSKPRVERPVPYVRDSFFRGRQFPSLEAMQRAAALWSREVAGRRASRALGGAQPLGVFEAAERETLTPLPRRPFELRTWWRPKVAPDCHAVVEGTLYSVPFRYVGRHLDARCSAREVAFFCDGELIKTHARAPKGRRQTDWAGYPPEKVAFLARTPAWCRRRAQELGEAVAAVVGELLRVNALHHLRAAQGVIGLADRYGPERLEAACRRALEAGDPAYRTVKGILHAGREVLAREEAGAGRTPAYPHGAQLLLGEEAGS